MRLIDADALMDAFRRYMAEKFDREKCVSEENCKTCESGCLWRKIVNSALTIDVVEVVRCEECIYYHKAHVLCNDGTEKDFSEFPQEAFGLFGYGVTAEYGINVGGKCEIEKNCEYVEDKSVFRRPDDFCSRGKRRDSDG